MGSILREFFHYLLADHYIVAWQIFNEQLLIHTICLPFLITQGLHIIDLIPSPAHAETLKSLQNGNLNMKKAELSAQEIKRH